jgi:hypothetical protein
MEPIDIPEETNWHVVCDQATFEKCRHDKKFPYIVALARAANALHSSYALLYGSLEIKTPDFVRNRMNSVLFSSAVMYEALRLIKKMNRPFADDEMFQNGLRLILKDPIAREVERRHLNPTRNHAVFHFEPAEFKQTIDKHLAGSCVFATGKDDAFRFTFADTVTMEMFVGLPFRGPGIFIQTT